MVSIYLEKIALYGANQTKPNIYSASLLKQVSKLYQLVVLLFL